MQPIQSYVKKTTTQISLVWKGRLTYGTYWYHVWVTHGIAVIYALHANALPVQIVSLRKVLGLRLKNLLGP